jgi:ssDNA-binding Zn-finger/Zn-ribbon topoisomerase 1
MAEVEVKCPKCGFVGVKKFGPLSNAEFSYAKNIYPICPIITERLDRNEQTGVDPLSCPHFHDQAARARPPSS